MYGTSFVSVVAVPQASGLAIGASGPSLKCRITSLKGCSGFFAKLRGHPPGRFVRFDRAFEAHRDAIARRFGVEVHGVRLFGDRTRIRSRRDRCSPCSDPGGRSGTLIVTVPIFEPDGHSTLFGSRCWICAGVHASRPCAADGVERHPFGQRDGRVFQLRGVDFFVAGCVRQRQFGRDAVGLIGLGGFRLSARTPARTARARRASRRCSLRCRSGSMYFFVAFWPP